MIFICFEDIFLVVKIIDVICFDFCVFFLWMFFYINLSDDIFEEKF